MAEERLGSVTPVKITDAWWQESVQAVDIETDVAIRMIVRANTWFTVSEVLDGVTFALERHVGRWL
jgi:hypothetical protein